MEMLKRSSDIVIKRFNKPNIKMSTSEIPILLASIGLITWEDIIESVYKGDSQCVCQNKTSFNFYTQYYAKYNNKYCRICDFNKNLTIFCFFRMGL